MIPLAIAALLILVVLTVLAVRYPAVGIAMIVISVVFSGYTVEVGPDGASLAAYSAMSQSLTVRFEYLLVPAGSLALGLGRVWRRQRLVLGRSIWIAGWIGVNVISSVLNSPDLSYSLRMIYFYVVGSLAYLGVVNYATDRARLRTVLILEALLVAIEAGFSLFLGGRWLDYGVVRLHGTLQEPVVFAGYMVPMSLLLLAWGIGSSEPRTAPRWLVPLAVVGLIMSSFSMSRASWGMALLGVMLILVFAWVWRPVPRRRLLAWAALGGGIFVAAMFIWIRLGPGLYTSYNDPFPDSLTTVDPGTGAPLEERIQSDTILWRLGVAREVFRTIRASPIVGLGTLTFGQTHDVFAVLSPTPSDGWIPTGSLLALHDTGIVGLVLYGLFLLVIAWDAFRVMRAGDPEARSLALGGLAGLIAWVGMEQMSTNMILGFGWVFLGLVSSVGVKGRQEPAEVGG